jgi:hypothetical protein
MKKLATTIALAMTLLFAGTSFAPVAMADPAGCIEGEPCPAPPPCGSAGFPACEEPVTDPLPAGCVDGEPCPTPPPCGSAGVPECPTNPDPLPAGCAASQPASAPVTLVAGGTARADRLEAVAERQAKQIKRLRAKIRSLR